MNLVICVERKSLRMKTAFIRLGRPKTKGNCNTCDKKGRKDVDCWTKEEDTSKRPKNWKNNNKGGGTGVKFLLTNIELLFYCHECN